MIRLILGFLLILILDVPNDNVMDIMSGFVLFLLLLYMMLSGIEDMQKDGIIELESLKDFFK